MSNHKITLFLMTEKGLATLKAVIDNNLGSYIDKVIVGTDRSVENDYSKDIINACESGNINVEARGDNTVNTAYAIAVSWRWLITLNSAKLIVFHDSLLPKYRGFAPLVNMLINKEDKIGVTALFASENYDEGDIIAQKSSSVKYPVKIKDAISQAAELYSALMVDVVKLIVSGTEIKAVKQDELEATYSLWRDEDDYNINWAWEADVIAGFIDAVGYPYKGAQCLLNNLPVTVISAEVVEDKKIENRDVGKVIFFNDHKPVVVCQKGLLKINEAVYTDTKENILPLKKFRSRFA